MFLIHWHILVFSIVLVGTTSTTSVNSANESQGFATLAERSDLVVYGRLEAEPPDTLYFLPESILKSSGPEASAKLAEARAALNEQDRGPTWRAGQKYVLFLVRDGESGNLVLVDDPAARTILSANELWQLEDLRVLVSGKPLEGRRVAEFVRRRGPGVLREVAFHTNSLEIPRFDPGDPEVQSALCEYLVTLHRSAQLEQRDLLALVDFLEPIHFDRMPKEAIERMTREYESLSKGYDGWFSAASFLAPFAARGDLWAEPLVSAFVDRTENETKDKTEVAEFQRWRMRAALLQMEYAPEEAQSRLWEIVETLPRDHKSRFDFCRFDVLRELLTRVPDRSEQFILKTAKEAMTSGGLVPFEVLLECRSTAALELRRRWIEACINRPEDLTRHESMRSLARNPAISEILHSHCDDFRKAARRADSSLHAARWLSYYWILGGDAESVSELISRVARGIQPTDFFTEDWIRACARVLGKNLLVWAQPTTEELTDALKILSRENRQTAPYPESRPQR